VRPSRLRVKKPAFFKRCAPLRPGVFGNCENASKNAADLTN
jgi:hypothetical protein